MPAWSTAVASELLKHALRHGDVLDQSRIQKLVYIAHGLRLAITGHPLTGDRPEACRSGLYTGVLPTPYEAPGTIR